MVKGTSVRTGEHPAGLMMCRPCGSSSARASFTLIELLVAVTISAIVILGVQAAFAQGKAVWSRVESRAPGLERLTAIVAMLRDEVGGLYLPPVKNVRPFEFERTETGEARLAFFTTSPGRHGSALRSRTVRVVYEHRLEGDRSTPSVLIRREQLYSGEKPIAEVTSEVVATGLTTMTVSFYDPQAKLEQDRWRTDPPSEDAPAAVRFRLGLAADDTEAVRHEPADVDAVLAIVCQATIVPPEAKEGGTE